MSLQFHASEAAHELYRQLQEKNIQRKFSYFILLPFE